MIDRQDREPVMVMKVELITDKIIIGNLDSGIQFIGDGLEPRIRGEALVFKSPDGLIAAERTAYGKTPAGGHVAQSPPDLLAIIFFHMKISFASAILRDR